MKLFKRAGAFLAAAALAGTLLTGCGSGAGSDHLVLKLSHANSTTHQYHLAAMRFKEEVEAKTNGQIEVEIFPAGQLGSQEEVTESVQLGTIDMVITSDDKLVNIVPEFGALGMPFLFKDSQDVCDQLNGEVGDYLSGLCEKKGVIIISWLENGFRQITNNKNPVYTPDDLKGQKIRVSSTKPNMQLFNNCGAQATNLSFGELYTALQLNTVDAQENPLSNIEDRKFFEVQKYLSISNHVHTAEPMAMSLDTWKKLTPEQQQILKEVGEEVSRWAYKQSELKFDEQLKSLEEKGMEVNYVDVDSFKTASDPVYDAFYDQYANVIEMVRKNQGGEN